MIALRLLDKDLYKSEKNIHEAGIYAYTNIQPEQCPANVDLVHWTYLRETFCSAK